MSEDPGRALKECKEWLGYKGPISDDILHFIQNYDDYYRYQNNIDEPYYDPESNLTKNEFRSIGDFQVSNVYSL